MLGLDVIEVMTPSGHPSIINKIVHILQSFFYRKDSVVNPATFSVLSNDS